MTSRVTAPFFYVREDEEVLLRSQPARGFAFAIFVVPAVLLTALAGVAHVADAAVGPLFVTLTGVRVITLVDIVYVALLVATALFAWRRYATTEYVVTDARIYSRVGRLRTSVHFTTHDKVTDIRYSRGILDRIFGVSNVAFATAGGNVRILGVRDALEVKETAESARDAFIQRLLEEAGVPEQAAAAVAAGETVTAERLADAAAPAPGEAPVAAEAPDAEAAPLPPPPSEWEGPRPDYVKRGDTLVWHGKPSLLAAVAGAAPVAGFLGFAIILGITTGQPRWLYAIPFIAVVALVGIGWNAVQLSFTEYVVTDKRVYVRTGVVGTTVKQLTYEKITDLTYRQDLPGRVLGYGGITVNTAGSNEAPVAMTGLTDPLQVKETVEHARARALREEAA